MPAPPASPVLRVVNVGHAYGAKEVLANVSFDVLAGRVTMLLGPNGAGKTTLFSLIARLLPLKQGQMTLEGEDLATASNQILGRLGIVFQQQTLDLDLSVAQNLYYYGALHGLSRAETRVRMAAALFRLELQDQERQKLRHLNGGHRRRVEIARMLMTGPRLLLLDEPTVGLDIPTRRGLVSFLHKLAIEENIGVLWATHLADEVEEHDDLVLLSKGRIVRAGSAAALIAATKTGMLGELLGQTEEAA